MHKLVTITPEPQPGKYDTHKITRGSSGAQIAQITPTSTEAKAGVAQPSTTSSAQAQSVETLAMHPAPNPSRTDAAKPLSPTFTADVVTFGTGRTPARRYLDQEPDMAPPPGAHSDRSCQRQE